MAATERFTFPTERAQRTTVLTGTASGHRTRYWELSDHIAYPDIRNIVADYINATISDPANTVRHGWTVTALPSADSPAHERRLLTLTCGGVDTLVVTQFSNDEDDSIELEMLVNTDTANGYSDEQLDFSTELVTATRGTADTADVWSWRIDIGALLTDDADIDFGISDDEFDDLAYALNSRSMADRAPDTSDHSDDLAGDLLAEAYRQLRDADDATVD
ncbi:hypothetical protein CH282_14440 [Rhodococcus sp. 06-418-1B]|nr:hypothetical protein [Rhodococcus sp. 06-418-1B]OZC84342.1 hypothetical protein CH282_14440 [Rhodococcus sp. 06-418-1B]